MSVLTHIQLLSSAQRRALPAMLVVCLVAGLAMARPAWASAVDDPPTPVEPAVITRDATLTKATVLARRITTPLRIDGRLDEEIYATAPAITGFIQTEPTEGRPATEPTDVWVFYDRENIYIVGRCWDSQPERAIAHEMRRDASVSVNDSFSFSLDTFHDRRSAYNFETNLLGSRWDGEIADDGAVVNASPNPVWETRSARFDRGWAIEARIPFKSLRYGSGDGQTWGLQVRRIVRWKNEISFMTSIPASVGQRGHLKPSLSASLVALELPPPSKNLEIKPYAISTLATDTTVRPRISNDVDADWGGDIKYSLSKNLKGDFTYNTDFAQAEADLQQINLTRFSLFFPEKREFFLENSGAYGFGGATGADNTPALFYSRRIGLSGSQIVPILAGGRVSGRAGRFTIGLLNMQTKDVPAASVRDTNFSVIRIRRDILRRSSIGGIFTNRSVAQNGVGSSQSYGFDGQILITNNLVVNTFWAQTQATGRPTDESYKGQIEFTGDRYGASFEHLMVGANFNPDVGFVRHPDLRRTYGLARFSPRPRRTNTTVRKFFYIGTIDYIENLAGRLDTRSATGEFQVEFQNSDRINAKLFDIYEFLPAPLTLAPGVSVPRGGHDSRSALVGYNLGPTRGKGLVNLSLEQGSFYTGTKTTFTVSNGVFSRPPHVIVEPSYSFNRVRLPQGDFTTHLLGPRFNFMPSSLMFFSALVQYNSTARRFSTNARLRWEYQPGSELFVVVNDQRDTTVSGFPELQNRALIVKVNRLLRF